MRGLFSLLAPSPSRYHPSAHRFTAERTFRVAIPALRAARTPAQRLRNVTAGIALCDARAIRFLCPHAAPTSAQRLRNAKATPGFPHCNPLPQAYYSFLAGAKRPERANAGANPHVNIERRHVCARRFDSPILTETYISAAIWTGRTATARPSRSRRSNHPANTGHRAVLGMAIGIGRVSAVFRLRQRERPSHRRSELPRLRLLPRRCMPGNHSRGPVRVPLVGHLELRQR